MFSLLRLCFVFYGEICFKSGKLCSFLFCHSIPSHYVRRRFPSVSDLRFRCCRKILFVNQKLTFDERISCITRHDDFSPRIHRAVYCKLPLSSEIAKAEATVAIVEPLKPNRNE